VRLDSCLKLGPEVSDQTLDGPSESLTESANGVSLNLLGELLHHVNLTLASSSLLEAVHDLLGPLGALATRGALPARLVVVELAETGDGTDNVGELVVADLPGKDGSGRATRNDSLEVVPATNDTTAVLVNKLTERDGHLLLDGARVVDVTRDTEELGASVTLTAELVEPVGTTADDRRGDSDSLDVGDSGRASEYTNGSREWRLQARLAGLALKRLDE
jgi:hypothetical protein